MSSIRLAALIALSVTIAVATRTSANPDIRTESPADGETRSAPRFVPDKTAVASDGTVYGISEDLGFIVTTDGGDTWTQRNAGLPRKVIYPFADEQQMRPLTALAVDALNPARVAVTTARDLFASEDRGVTWERIAAMPTGARQQGWPGSVTYLTSVALSPASRDAFLIGTSFEGFYETTDRGRTWSDPSAKARFVDRGAHFFEEIAGISYDPTEPGVITFGLGFGYGVYRSSADREKHTDLGFPGSAAGEVIRLLQHEADGSLRVLTDRAVWVHARGTWERLGRIDRPPVRLDPASADRQQRASNHTGIYLSSFTAGRPRVDELLGWIKQQGMDSIVVDFKDDDGILAYDSALELPRAMGIVRKRFDPKQLLAKAHEAGIYVIARVLVFKDRAMYGWRDGAYAAWDRSRGAPWRNLVKREDEAKNVTWVQVEHWVDPYSEVVWNHNIAIAKEVQDLGVDEIQFDYIRFPTDGDLSTVGYRHWKPGMTQLDALESFLVKAREALHVPISTDLYGFNSWHRMGHWNGQSIELVSHYVDVIAPMYYPSHFPSDFLRPIPYVERARRIYEEGTTRSASIVQGRSLIRPYVQAFRIYGELKMTPEEYARYLRVQLEGTTAARASGWTLWNASNDYYMASFPLAEFLPRRPPEAGAPRDRPQ